MYRKTALISLLLTLVLFTGCATALAGRKQTVRINTKPEGATAYIFSTCKPDVSMTVTTPAEVKLSPKATYHVRIRKEGFQPVNTGLGHKTNNNIFLDVLWVAAHGEDGVLAFIGSGFLLVDHLMGNVWKLDPEEINVELKEEKQ